ncbi:MAG: hypothetical protein Q8P59_14335, partial [Dehalococcoidia bacterium]|nr:hypothetical protein [Dehalococcoidia bacterium]
MAVLAASVPWQSLAWHPILSVTVFLGRAPYRSGTDGSALSNGCYWGMPPNPQRVLAAPCGHLFGWNEKGDTPFEPRQKDWRPSALPANGVVKKGPAP